MSNLIKSVYFNVANGENRIIESESRAEEILPEIYHPEAFSQNAGLAEGDGDFVSGLDVIHVDDVLKEERERLEQESAQIEQEAKIRAEQIINEAKEAAENIRNNAYEEGKKQGFEAGKLDADILLHQKEEELAIKEKELIDSYYEQMENLEPAFVDILISLVEKVTGVVVENKKDVLIYLIDNALKGVSKSKRILLRVSKEDMLRVSAKKQAFLQNLAEGIDFDIVEESTLEKNQCIIETEDKMLDCSLDVQLENLTEQLKLLTYM